MAAVGCYVVQPSDKDELMLWMTRVALLLGLACGPAAWAQTAAAPDPEQAASQANIQKLNAYVGLLNRTLRASDSLARYASWVNMKTGPSGRERIIYGLYSLNDVRGEIEKAKAATTVAPEMPDLDAGIRSYIAAYEALAPVIGQADAYYDREDYKVDGMAEGKALHVKLAPAGQAFLLERTKVDALFAKEKSKSDAAELASVERSEGRKARWHAMNVMIRARQVVDLLPNENKPVVDVASFDATLAVYAASVRELDEYAAANPGLFSSFESQPRSFLGRLREFRDKIARARGDVRRGGANDLTWIVNTYNSMISASRTAVQVSR